MEPPVPASDRKSIKSVDNTLDILEYLSHHGDATLTELADEVGYTKSNVHYYLQTLIKRRYVVEEDHRYRVGLKTLDLGGGALARNPLNVAGPREVETLASETNDDAFIAVEEDGRTVIVWLAHGGDSTPSNLRIGSRFPLHQSALGKAILAYADDAYIDAYLEYVGLEAATKRTITTPDALHDELRQIRERGLAFEDQERIDGIRSLATPILVEGNPIGSVGVTAGAEDIRDPNKGIKARRFATERPTLVKQTAQRLSETLDSMV